MIVFPSYRRPDNIKSRAGLQFDTYAVEYVKFHVASANKTGILPTYILSKL